MTAYNGYLSVGGTIVGGVLTEMVGLPRVPVAGDNPGTGTVTLPAGATLGPVPAPGGTLTAFAVFAAATGNDMLFTGTLAALAAAAGQYITFPAGAYAVTAAPALDAGVLTLNGLPLTIGGQPLQVPGPGTLDFSQQADSAFVDVV